MADQLSSSVELGLKLSRRVYYAEGGVDLNSLPHHQVCWNDISDSYVMIG